MRSGGDLYLDLMKRCLTNWVYGDTEEIEVLPDGFLKRRIIGACLGAGARIKVPQPFDERSRAEGRDWPPPPTAHTMVGLKRLENLRQCVENVLANNIPGDFIETGVWRGGAAIFMRAVLKVYGVKDRLVWVADSFEGLPPPNPQKFPCDAGDNFSSIKELAVSLEQVKANFERYGLLDDQVRFLKGWFRDTLPTAPVEKLAVMRLDGDMYESTMDTFVNLYPKLSSGGYVIVDDYGAVPACRQAVQDYRASHGITETIYAIDWTGVYWQRS